MAAPPCTSSAIRRRNGVSNTLSKSAPWHPRWFGVARDQGDYPLDVPRRTPANGGERDGNRRRRPGRQRWPDRARHAAEMLTAERDNNTVASDRIRPLTDCRAAFGQADAIPTAVLLDRLKADPEAPWAEYAGTGLTRHAARCAAARLRDPTRHDPVRAAARPGQRLPAGRVHRRVATLLPRPGGRAVPAVSQQLRGGTA